MNLRSKALIIATTVFASSTAEAFMLIREQRQSTRSRTASFSHLDDNQTTERVASTTRRRLLSQKFPLVFITGVTASTASALSSNPALAAAADSPLFQGNPLTNSVLEQIRIWEQAEADNLKYGGELERGDAGNKGNTSAYPKLLVPILAMAKELDAISQTVQTNKGAGPSRYYAEVMQILRQPKYNKIEFKRVFNAFADNIYYSDPDRANLYLAGGATPKTEQSLAYLLRNEILTSIEDMRAELEYLSQHPDESDEDFLVLAASASNAMQRYLAVVPPKELAQAREMMTKL